MEVRILSTAAHSSLSKGCTISSVPGAASTTTLVVAGEMLLIWRLVMGWSMIRLASNCCGSRGWMQVNKSRSTSTSIKPTAARFLRIHRNVLPQ